MATYVFIAWTAVVWLGRVRNIVAGDDALIGLLVPLASVGAAAWAVIDRRRGVLALALLTAVVWFVRLPMVVAHDHSPAFKLVHAALAAVSLALAYVSVVQTGRSCGPTVGTGLSRPRRSS